ncbi:MAG: ABC transporter ATP-binding protein [Geobacteraceae bacterium]|nr:ABC transporter ATP-binding protein [Geobacteraceae bacterium]
MLKVEGITQNFGGVTALSDVSFSVAKGEIKGVIGPNGAGKTTLFNIISGVYSQTAGKVFLDHDDVTGLSPEKLALRRMVRTFQNIELFNGLSVLENVMVGVHTRSRSGVLSCSLKLPRHLKEERAIRETAMDCLKFVGIEDLADMAAESLPFGKGRMLEIARAMALDPVIILLDEPAAGLNSRETTELGRLIGKIRDSGVTVALVEHDMELVMEICDSIVVLNLGKKLAEGTPREIQENHEVIAAYLGE